MSAAPSLLTKELIELWQSLEDVLPKMLSWLWKALQALTPVFSAGTAIVALHISRVNAKNTARTTEAKAIQEARAVAFAISPSIVKITKDCMNLRGSFSEIISNHQDKVGQTVAGAVLSLTFEMPPILDRDLERLGALPDSVGRDCFILVSMLLSFNDSVIQNANWIGARDGGQWHKKLVERLMALDSLRRHADCALASLEQVMATPIP